jgi:hypothetical protein
MLRAEAAAVCELDSVRTIHLTEGIRTKSFRSAEHKIRFLYLVLSNISIKKIILNNLK